MSYFICLSLLLIMAIVDGSLLKENKRLKAKLLSITANKKCPLENSPDFKDCKCCDHCPISKSFK